jgi:hypothetical protein
MTLCRQLGADKDAVPTMPLSHAEMEPPYREALGNILSFSTFAEAEQTLNNLDNLWQIYRASSDKKGMEYCKQIALLGRRRAEFISHNKRVNPAKRLQKKEIAVWFKVWLETPTIFSDWLAMRKKTAEFSKLTALEKS